MCDRLIGILGIAMGNGLGASCGGVGRPESTTGQSDSASRRAGFYRHLFDPQEVAFWLKPAASGTVVRLRLRMRPDELISTQLYAVPQRPILECEAAIIAAARPGGLRHETDCDMYSRLNQPSRPATSRWTIVAGVVLVCGVGAACGTQSSAAPTAPTPPSPRTPPTSPLTLTITAPTSPVSVGAPALIGVTLMHSVAARMALDFGDGTVHDSDFAEAGVAVVQILHAFRAAGRYTVTVTVRADHTTTNGSVDVLVQ
jgi:hypothetical protein